MNDHRKVRAAYDEVAVHYREATDESEAPVPEPVEQFCAALDADDRLLAAGCGSGDRPLAAAGDSAVGLDFSREQLRLADDRHQAALVQADMSALPFADDAFDAVAALYSLIHVPDETQQTVLAEFARVLTPGGRLLVTEGGTEWTGSNPDWLGDGTEMWWSLAGPEQTREDLRACGFKIQEVWDVQDPLADEGEKPFFLATLP